MKGESELGALIEASINRISHSRGRVLTLMAKASVTVPQVILLNFALKNPDSTPSSLAAILKISLPSVSQMIERLVKLGLAQRTEDSKDRRRKTVSVTSKGRTLLIRLEAVRAAEYATGAANLSEATRRRLADALARAAAAIGAVRWLAPSRHFRRCRRMRKRWGCPSRKPSGRLRFPFQRHTATTAAFDSTVLQSGDDSFQRGQGVPSAVRFALFEIVSGLRHRVRALARQSTGASALRA
jgi:DNA-binding MarR family transcriptional regulator